MKTIFLTTVLTVLSTLISFAQISFEKGYIIDNEGNKTICYIKNKQWRNNPVEFNYKLKENSPTLTGNIKDFSAFSIDGNKMKYVRYSIDMDRSSSVVAEISKEKTPSFTTETLFLKTLVEGEATLYSYNEASLSRYFYATKQGEVKQLIYKLYALNGRDIRANEKFKQQIFNDLKCESNSNLEHLKYEKNQLVKVFVNYNQCKNEAYTVYSKADKIDIKLAIKPGLNYKALNLYGINREDILFGNQPHFRIGLSSEFVLGFNNKKWSVLVEPTYQYFNSSLSVDPPPNILINTPPTLAQVNYQSLEIPIGLRHYFFLNKHSKIFLNGFIAYSIPLEAQVTYGTIDLSDYTNAWLGEIGIGYSYKQLSGEIRYASNKNIIPGFFSWTSNYGGASLVLGYELF